MTTQDDAGRRANVSPRDLIPQLGAEPARAYAALLAFAGQPLGERNMSALATALDVSRTTLHRYQKDWRWNDRLEPWDKRQVTMTVAAARVEADELTSEVIALRQQVVDVRAYIARTKASADLALTLALQIGQKVLKRITSITDDEWAKMTPRDLTALAALVPRLADHGILALGELHGAHEYAEFLTQQAKMGDGPALVPDEAEA